MEHQALIVSTEDGRRLQATVAGPAGGELVLLHHGTPGAGREIWPANLASAAERGLRLAGYSRPGYGDSDRAEGRTVADCVADAAAVADAVGAERFFTIGGSGGGPHALACAALLPGRVIAAATIAAVAPADAEGLDWLAGMGAENVAELTAARAGPTELERFIDGFAEQLASISGAQVLDALGDLASEPDAAVLTGEYAEFAAAGMREALRTGIWGWFDDDRALITEWGFDPGSIEVPVTLWQGLQDRMVPAAHGEWLAAHVAGARSHLLAEHGHISLSLANFGEILDQLRG